MVRRPISVIELSGYRRRASSLLSRDEQDAVIDLVAYEPTCGDVIQGTGGLRKVRVGRGHGGKRGGARVVYYFHDDSIPIHLLAFYAKNEKSDLSAAEKKEFAGSHQGDCGAMAKKIVRRRLADDIRASLREVLDHAAGKRTKAVVHKVMPRATDAREARIKLGLSQREFASLIGTGVGTVRKWELGTRTPSGAARALIAIIKSEPKAVRRALAKGDVAA